MEAKEFNKKSQDKEKSRNDAYRTVFTGPGGWIVFEDLLNEMEFWKASTFVGDARMAAFNDGKKAAILHIMERLVEAGVMKSKEDLLKPIFLPNVGQPIS